MLRMRANVGFPMPAAFAFLSFGMGDGNRSFELAVVGLNFELRDVQEFAQGFQAAVEVESGGA